MKSLNSILYRLGLSLAFPLLGLAAEQPLVIDATHSSVTIEVKATVDSFTAKIPTGDLAITVDPATGRVAAAHAAFKFIDVKTGKPDRDRAMHEWQDTAHFPNVIFDLKMFTLTPEGTWLVTGDFTLHGQTHRLSFPVTIQHSGQNYVIEGQVPFDTRDYELPVIRKFGLLKVNPELLVRFHLEGHSQEN